MFDSHCHLDFSEISHSIGAKLAAAHELGVHGWVVPGCFVGQWRKLAELQQDSRLAEFDISVCVGQHPRWAGDILDMADFGDVLSSACQAMGPVAVGECGLDRGSSVPLALQAQVFELQLHVARELELPVILHQVGEQEQFLRSLKRVGLSPARGVVHGFGGNHAWGAALISRGFFLGVGPAITRPNRSKLRQAIGGLPLESLLLETDAPDQRLACAEGPGEPLDLTTVCRAVAEVMQVSSVIVSQKTEQNTRALFRL